MADARANRRDARIAAGRPFGRVLVVFGASLMETCFFPFAGPRVMQSKVSCLPFRWFGWKRMCGGVHSSTVNMRLGLEFAIQGLFEGVKPTGRYRPLQACSQRWQHLGW